MTAGRLSAYDQIRATVLRWIEDQRVDPGNEPAIRHRTEEAIRQWQRSAAASERRGLGDVDAISDRVVRSITGFGPLSGLFDAAGVEEIEIEGDLVMYVDASGRRQTLVAPTTEEENRQAIDRLLAATQRHLDTQSPLVHARVLGGRARLSAAIPPVADKLSCTIRFHQLRNESLASMVRRGSLTWPAAGFLWAVAQTRLSLVISGPPFAGKTSMLGAVLAAVPPQRRIRVVEDTRELVDERPTISYLESRARSLAGEGEITLRDLIKFVLKMRPDYIVVGEVLGAEAFEIVRAVNAGCGFACTVHANSARDALTALVNAAIMAGENVKSTDVREVLASSVKYVMHLEVQEGDGVLGRGPGLLRQTRELIELVPSLHDDFSHEVLFTRAALGKPLVWTGTMPHNAEVIDRTLPRGLSVSAILEGRISPFELREFELRETTFHQELAP
ncbi:MAG TPA: ATPase, T2SS/T4P/T4SS family [Actinomycetes bacterium]|jgi:pilus assembly protein CpaF|nr:ATPase, T2SS/T4P/T4SS family [Actinomycetes bacterium]